MDVVNGEIVMVESEGEKIWCGVKRPSTCMHGVEQSGLSERAASNSRARLTESGGWAHPQGATKHDHCGEFYNSGSMARAEGYSSAGFHHGANNSSRNMAFGTGGTGGRTGRLHRLEFGGKGLEAPSLAQFKHPPPPLPCNSRNSSGGHSSSTLQTMNPVPSGASLRMTMNTSSMTMVCPPSPPATPSVATFHSKGLVTPGGADLGARLGTAPFSRVAGEDHSHDHDLVRRHRHKRSSATSFDREITNFESQIAQTAAKNIMRLQPAHSMSRPHEDAAAAVVDEEQKDMVEEKRSGSGELSLGLHAHPPSSDTKVAGANSSGKGLCSDSSMPFVDLSLGTKSLANSGGDDVKVYTWIEPLKFLLRKQLSVSDAGELSRVILPKKDAESQLPLVDVREGILISMVDHDCKKQWVFRYKWWLNNKSRMYVLENTGDFMKYHNLKEKDALTLYKDDVGTIVIHGEKSREVFTIEYISKIGSTVASQSSLDDSSGHATCHNLPAAAIAPELLINASPKHEDLPSSAPVNAIEVMGDDPNSPH